MRRPNQSHYVPRWLTFTVACVVIFAFIGAVFVALMGSSRADSDTELKIVGIGAVGIGALIILGNGFLQSLNTVGIGKESPTLKALREAFTSWSNNRSMTRSQSSIDDDEKQFNLMDLMTDQHPSDDKKR